MCKNKQMLKQISVISAISLMLSSVSVIAQPTVEDQQSLQLHAVTITGDAQERAKTPGSVHKIDEATLKQWHYSDINRVLEDAPGVYLRREDGYGLRPNIGMRGSDSNRSSKITLMEDGVLFAPAPYAAPAAYFFPLMQRIQAIEVSKGPSSIKYGPYTVGGAINFVSRDIPSGSSEDGNGLLDIGLGSYGFGQLHGYYGDSSEKFAWSVEGVHVKTDGFKELDGKGETGFDKNDVLLKLRFNSDPHAEVYHQFDVKVGHATETSNETYLGLTDADFEANPHRRYVASQSDLMQWNRQQVSVNHFLDYKGDFSVNTTVYWNQFARVWDKINGFTGASSPSLSDVLSSPNSPAHSIYYQLLTGSANSSNQQENILLQANDRTYMAKGVQSQLDWEVDIAGQLHEFNIGVRYHEDEVTRNHTSREFLMQNGSLVNTGNAPVSVTKNHVTAKALAMYLYDEVTLGDLTLSGGVRGEFIKTEFVDLKANKTVALNDSVILPGAGLSYKLSPKMRLLAGVHGGFVPVVPGSDASVKQEKSTNYEMGINYISPKIEASVIGFFSDYSNLSGTCTFSSGCSNENLDLGFNAGEVNIYGVEAEVSKTLNKVFNSDYNMPLRLVYTYTSSKFISDFTSPRPDLANVKAGDALPNLPEHMLTARVGLTNNLLQTAVSLNYVAPMRTVAGRGELLKAESTDEQLVVDFSVNYILNKQGKLYFTVDNVFDKTALVARRPYGVRPGKPRTFLLGYQIKF